MHVATVERNYSVERLEEFKEFFKHFDYEVTKASIPAAYQAPVASWLESGTLRETVRHGKLQCVVVGAPLLSDTPITDFSGSIKFVMRSGDMLIERLAFLDFDCAKETIDQILKE